MLEVTVRKKLGDFSLNADFSCDSKRIGILGASGSGKSLTLGTIAGLVKPDEGRIFFEDRVFFDSSDKINLKTDRRRVGYLFQDYALFPNMTVKNNILAAIDGAKRRARLEIRHKTESDDKILFQKMDTDSILKHFDLWELRDHLPGELSGGQKQRTALARMLATDPVLLLLDEPFSAMDTFLREGMRLELLRILDEFNRTAILVSHDRDEVYQLCDHLILLDDGKVIDQGKTDELFLHPGSVRSAKLTGCKNISRVEIKGDHKIKALDWGGLELVTECKVEDDIRYAGIRAHDFTIGKAEINSIPTGKAKISRLPFEWYVTLENGLWWKISKDINENDTFEIPGFLSIAPAKILLMK
ncbi:MAG: ATP-binding cassette domain-containing protein [Lachnospiraceae bacterium]|nr:ATP-binding cassette domain-containing protein [Lachnospiraceae bacterium]